MAEAGIGVHMVEIGRVATALQHTPRIAVRFFTEEERAHCDRGLRPAARYASLLAARVAVCRALGMEPRELASRWDVTVSFDGAGAPSVELAGAARERAQATGVEEVAISLSTADQLAVANALAVTRDVRPRPREDKEDGRAKLARSFREVRSVLDELERVQEDDGDPSGADAGAAQGSAPGSAPRDGTAGGDQAARHAARDAVPAA